MHILLIEDDLDLGRALQAALKVEGLTSEWLRRAADAPRLVDASVVDCVLLDLTLPDGHGFDLLTRWRRAGVVVPIIVITARSAVADRLTGLDGGADDFVVKPFATAELMSRIRAVLRRVARQSSDVWTLGDLVIEPRRHIAQLSGVVTCRRVSSICCWSWRASPVRW
jgi:two-component system, OmpR family, response regulator QseB